MLATITGWMFGILVGMRHALEPDHLAAVSTLLAERRSSRWTFFLLGAAWGVGHTLTLFLVGGGLLLLGKHMPEKMESAFELAVSLMLLVLGGRALRQAWRDARTGPLHTHQHIRLGGGVAEHTHAGTDPHIHIRGWRFALRPLLIGLVHGLAGTGALTALVLAQFSTATEGLVYILLFGIGSTMGMALLTGLLGMPLASFFQRPRVLSALALVTGLVSVALAFVWGWPNMIKLIA